MIDVLPLPWYVFQSGGNQEFFAERQLNRQHFDTYVPYEMVNKTRKGVIIGTHRRALFRSYGFVRFNVDTDKWRPICSSPGIKRLLSTTPEHPIPVPEGTVESLQWAVLALKDLDDDHDIVAVPIEPVLPAIHSHTILTDREVEVLRGPFATNIGIVKSTSRARAKVLLDVLGGKVPVSFRLVNLRMLPQTTE